MIVALEEHYFDADWNNHFDPVHHTAKPANPLIKRMEDLGAVRIKEMDEAGIDLQVISHGPPGAQGLRGDAAVAWTAAANDRLYAAIKLHPTRFAGFASLPTDDPDAAANELQRAVEQLGFKGGILHSLTQGPFLDDKRYWPIFARAAALDVPLYIHPADPLPAVVKAYYGDYAKTHPMFIRAAWGFTFEAGTQAMRLVLSGVFEAYPGLKLILGHLGETIPYALARIDEALSRDTPMKNFREVFTSHFYVTTSGFFSDPALQCCIQELGLDRIMFSVDWPFASNVKGVEWLKKTPLSDADREKLASGNAKRLLKL
ncbi:MAG: amidohydrolase [Rhizobiales bacterium]|nr:amidohydrolase [Hyphomicrobiales bacterium]